MKFTHAQKLSTVGERRKLKPAETQILHVSIVVSVFLSSLPNRYFAVLRLKPLNQSAQVDRCLLIIPIGHDDTFDIISKLSSSGGWARVRVLLKIWSFKFDLST